MLIVAVTACGDDAVDGADTDDVASTSAAAPGSTAPSGVTSEGTQGEDTSGGSGSDTSVDPTSGPDSDSDSGSETDDSSDRPPCVGTHFGDALEWMVPYPADVAANGYHAVLDMNDDGFPDFVQTDQEAGSGSAQLGETHWVVYFGSGSGFSDSPQDWALPYPADVLANGYHAILDIDGDGLPDFVQTDQENGNGPDTLGMTRWDVYLGDGVGFADSPTAWAIPYPADVLSNGYHAVLDMNADGIPDFVQTDQESGNGANELGISRWDVYLGGASGFAEVAAAWAIPYPADVLANGYHAVLDLDGDSFADFVQTDQENGNGADELGMSRWGLHTGNGAGFANAAHGWAIPYAADVLANGHHSVLDMDGQGPPDFIQTDQEGGVGPNAGMDAWVLYSNDGSGFADASPWPIPYPADVFANGYHVVMDLTGDGLPDFVQTDDEAGNGTPDIGTSHWRVFPGACDE